MESNGFQRNNETIAEDETPTKPPRSSREMPGCPPGEASDEAASPAATAERTCGSSARQAADSVKKTRPRRCCRRTRAECIYWITVTPFTDEPEQAAILIKARRVNVAIVVLNCTASCDEGLHYRVIRAVWRRQVAGTDVTARWRSRYTVSCCFRQGSRLRAGRLEFYMF